MDQKFETNRKPIQEMDIGKRKILDESLPLPQMNNVYMQSYSVSTFPVW